ncbi:lipoprotein [Spiroplasma endosymbiont of Agriotes lineatus]
MILTVFGQTQIIKKLLLILGAITLIGTSTTSLISC